MMGVMMLRKMTIGKNETLILADPTVADESNVSMELTLLGEVDIMGRNDKCFCGSDKKLKHCHPNINEQSIVAKLLHSYYMIDIRNSMAKTVCIKGCADCCTEDFQVKLWEFFAILEYLDIGRGYNKEMAEQLKQKALVTHGSCIFLEQKEISIKRKYSKISH